MRLGESKTENFKILRSFRQGSILLPSIYNLYNENIFNVAHNGVEDSIHLNEARINHLRYAEDTIISAGRNTGLQFNIPDSSEYHSY